VFLANDVMTQKQVACKIVDLRKNAVELDKQDISLDGPHRIEVQAFAEQKKGVTEVRKKLIREVEILSKLGHVGTQPSPSVIVANDYSQTLLLSTKLFVRHILCKLACRDPILVC